MDTKQQIKMTFMEIKSDLKCEVWGVQKMESRCWGIEEIQRWDAKK